MANSTSFLGCSRFYATFEENLKLMGQLVYLIPSFILISKMIYVIQVKHRGDYHEQRRFWLLYTMDLALSLLNLFFDIFYYRLTLFVPQICESFSFFLRANPLLIDITYPLWFYFHVGKMVAQMSISFERMTFNLLKPNDYRRIWKHGLTACVIMIIFVPFSIIWNILISDKYIQFYFGGFQPNYSRRVNWFGTTAWQLTYMQISMAVTLLSNIVTGAILWKSQNQSRKSRLLCRIWFAISTEYLLSACAFCYLHMKTFAFDYSNLIFMLVIFVWDGFNILSPVIMISMNKSLRKQVFAMSGGSEDLEISVA
ncbi:Serpentine receptor class gamma-6 [Caenorhabditis elegans]|uniref:Serpentine receptor class gamma-6 n=1 Tax=Caenorhabditis elegans TaxID=6239 RepID=SRG6_CAEEL|nr:Serpentine receptor class gamma-6 [Caenorhabditis elegans]P54128.1 RecName: Full=Serpentine receptor class gamma-6; Short=Protein srg-6 [Caenorhabditis elegans]CCD65218.1 Serpentine receptor class gamma-6 [Caenorhabditis elegans]|eukprot:NP_001293633.1 Serpentine receptor class gamma-6 [Caenorhabditis elegans]